MNQPPKSTSRKTVRVHVKKLDGTTAFMYNEQAMAAMVDAGHRPTVKRMSQVSFNNDSQQWEARDTKGELIAVAPTYEQCVNDEVVVLDGRTLTEE